MILKNSTCILVMASIFLLSSSCWALDFKPGKYEITSETEMEGMPQGMPGSIPPQTIVQCLTKQEPVPDQTANGACSVSQMKTTGNTISWTMECNQQGVTSKGSGKMTYAGDSFSGLFKTSMGAQGGNMKVTTRMKGRRIGDCP